MGKPVVAFVCTHNACRSQIAEAMARRFADDVMLARSAGTHPTKIVNPDAARLLASEYEFDVASLEPKSLTCLPDVDILITMGCGVECPSLPAMYREGWGLEDPTGKGDDAFLRTMRAIQQRVIGLRARIVDGEEQCACNLLSELEISQPTLSHHMAALRDAGIVRARKDGRWMHYQLDHDVLDAIAALLGQSIAYRAWEDPEE